MTDDRKLPWLPSFARRRGRGVGQHKQHLFETLYPTIQITLGQGGNLAETVKAAPEIWFEIGFGAGEHIAGQAARNPNVLCIGCEPYYEGVASLLTHIHNNDLKNVRVFMDDARLLVQEMPPESVDRMFILFPDPWPKKRHNERRIVSLPSLNRFAPMLKKGGTLHLATDHEDYATWMLEHVLAQGEFTWNAKTQSDWQNAPADWVVTRYETKTRAQGRAPVYYHFTKQ